MPSQISTASIETVIDHKLKDLGGITVRRTLPTDDRRTIGPFILLDHFGPVDIPPGVDADTRPHPHIGMATLTYLFEGEIVHRDSIGTEQTVRAGDISWMTAGSGIVHSERIPPHLHEKGQRVHGLQSLLALPLDEEEIAPSYQHYPASAQPVIEDGAVSMCLIAGRAFGKEAPVKTHSGMFYLAAEVAEAAIVPLPDDHEERAVYVADGTVDVDGMSFDVGQMIVLTPGHEIILRTPSAAKLMLLGGEHLPGKRYLDWNFVASSKERIEQAKADWATQRFDKIPGETEFIPLPEE